MKKKIVWLLVSSLMVLSLVMASCAPAVVEEEEEKAPVTEEKAPEEKVEEVVAPTVEKPKYGGVHKVGIEKTIYIFDQVVGRPSQAFTLQVTNETLWGGDWARGPAGGYGTNETDWTGYMTIYKNRAGYIAESWELPKEVEGETGAVIFHIRQGIHWALNPDSEASRLVGGRELTTDDVLFSLKQTITDSRAFIYQSNPELRVAKITSPSPWTVKIEIPWEAFQMAVDRFCESVYIVPPEVVQKLGDMDDWRLAVGTGPFILTDFVSGSTATMTRNPNYWMKDPIGPGKGNQLPYLDAVKYFTIADRSTMFAALRTAKIDWVGNSGGGFGMNIEYEDVVSLKKTTPQLMSKSIEQAEITGAIALKVKNAPFNDIRVRRAMMMAIDYEGIKRDLYGGEAQIVMYPIPYVKDFADAYYGPDEQGQWPSDCPESIKELYTYNPEKAKALLAEAGYPRGFKTNIIIEPTPEEIDFYSIYVDMWSKVGIDCELRPTEVAAVETIKVKKSFDQMIAELNPKVGKLYIGPFFYGTGRDNQSEIDDPVVNEAYAKIRSACILDMPEANRLHKELMKYVLDQAWAIPRVTAPKYSLWWPWLKNYSGEQAMHLARYYNWVWIDQELKRSMGY